MKRNVSFKVFLAKVGKGLKHTATRFFGLFGYKREGRYAMWVWRVFATSAAVFMTIMACLLVYRLADVIVDKWRGPYANCQNVNYDCNEPIGKRIYYHNHDDGKGYIYDSRTGMKLVENVDWIAKPDDEKERLVCFSNGEKRGYFDKHTGQVVIEPKYNHAWIFSDGLACVDDMGSLKFIDQTGKVVFDPKIAYTPQSDGLIFHHGYCVVVSEKDNLFGLMDKNGKMAVAQEYDNIIASYDGSLWCLKKGSRMAVLDKNLLPVLPMSEWELEFEADKICATMPDHTTRMYDERGQLINDFYVYSVDKLVYEKNEAVTKEEGGDDGCGITEYTVSHPLETARLRAYTTPDGYRGLMTEDGKIVTRPEYLSIEAIGYDLYLCSVGINKSAVLNGKGELVRPN